MSLETIDRCLDGMKEDENFFEELFNTFVRIVRYYPRRVEYQIDLMQRSILHL